MTERPRVVALIVEYITLCLIRSLKS